MKFIIILLVFASIISSCNQSSKGSWSDDDIKSAKKDLQNVSASLDVLGGKKQEFMDCYLQKIEENYDSYDEFKNDKRDNDKHVAECMQEVILSGLK